MAHGHAAKLTESVHLPEGFGAARTMFGIGVLGLIASAVGFFLDKEQFFFSYLVAFTFFASIGIASMLLVMIHHITNSSWGTAIRRLPETFASNMWIWAIFFVPILFGLYELYHWTHEKDVLADPILLGKVPFLNEPFFIVRQVLYFAIWGAVGFFLHRWSTNMDKTGNWGLIRNFRLLSAPGLLILAFTIAFAGFDWLMSLDPHWFSTMWGVYFFAMSFQTLFPVLLLMIVFLRSRGVLSKTITSGHVYDLTAWFFGFSVFYAYIAFSQFLLIYYANIPEETLWYYHRLEGSWEIITFTLFIGRFILPFVLLLNRDNKRKVPLIVTVSSLVVFIHFLEIHWIVMPILNHHGIALSWMDVTTFLGLGGIFMGLFFYRLGRHALVPVKDPKLAKSLTSEFHN